MLAILMVLWSVLFLPLGTWAVLCNGATVNVSVPNATYPQYVDGSGNCRIDVGYGSTTNLSTSSVVLLNGDTPIGSCTHILYGVGFRLGNNKLCTSGLASGDSVSVVWEAVPAVTQILAFSGTHDSTVFCSGPLDEAIDCDITGTSGNEVVYIWGTGNLSLNGGADYVSTFESAAPTIDTGNGNDTVYTYDTSTPTITCSGGTDHAYVEDASSPTFPGGHSCTIHDNSSAYP